MPKYSYGSMNLFHSDDNCSELGAILDDLLIEINVFSHICILHHCLHLKTVMFSQFNCLLRLMIKSTGAKMHGPRLSFSNEKWH